MAQPNGSRSTANSVTGPSALPNRPLAPNEACRSRPAGGGRERQASFGAKGRFGNAEGPVTEFAVLRLPFGWAIRWRHLHRGHFVLGTVGCPVGVLCGHDIRLRIRM